MKVKIERCDELPETYLASAIQTDDRGDLILTDEYGNDIAWYGAGAWTKVSFDYSDEVEETA